MLGVASPLICNVCKIIISEADWSPIPNITLSHGANITGLGISISRFNFLKSASNGRKVLRETSVHELIPWVPFGRFRDNATMPTGTFTHPPLSEFCVRPQRIVILKLRSA